VTLGYRYEIQISLKGKIMNFDKMMKKKDGKGIMYGDNLSYSPYTINIMDHN